MKPASPCILDDTLTARTFVQCSMWRHQRVAQILMLLIAFCIPLATTVAEVLIGIYVYCWIGALEFGPKLRVIARNRICQMFLAMCCLILLGALWSCGSVHETLRGIIKHREFAYVPLFITSCRQAWVRTWGLRMFMAGATVLLGLSYAEWLGAVDLGLASTVGLGDGASAGYVIFKDRIVHSLLIAFLTFLYAHVFIDRPAWRPLSGAAVLLCAGNLFFLVQGRTGYLVLLALTVLFLIQRCGLRGLAYAAVIVPLMGASAWLASDVVRDRVQATITQLQNQFGPEKRRSPDARLEFYETSLAVFQKQPWFGTGTGGFSRAYRAESRRIGTPFTDDPHCEYLVIAVQWGLLGLGIFGFLLMRAIRATALLPVHERRVAQAMLVTVISGGMFNSLLLGFTGGLFFSVFAALCFGGLPETALIRRRETEGEVPTSSGSQPAISRAA